MEINWPTLIGNVVVGLLVAVVSARVTVYFALKRFYSEKWWERKAEAYGTIIEALHHMKNYADQHMEFEMRGSELPEDRKKELTENFKRGHGEVRKRADVGTFVICEEAVGALVALEKDLEASGNTTDWWEHLDLEYAAVSKCLKTMRDIAKEDLRIP